MDVYPSCSAIWVKFIRFVRMSCLAAFTFIREKVLDDPQPALLAEDLLELGTADQVLPAHFLDGHMPVQVRFQIVGPPG